ncbi:MAG: hypothetical protein N2036_10470 [Bryobacteraceae bacterium]|nr:hypothetical protein [Bryobacteraceae bacterium]
MALPSDSPLTATAIATAVVSIGLASLVWHRRLARLENLKRQIGAIRGLSREVLRLADAPSAAARIEEQLRTILGDRSLKAALGTPGEPPQRASMPPFHLRFPLNAQENKPEFLDIWHSDESGFSAEILEALADLAHHAGIAAELRSQRQFREQMARTEQMAATGLLLSAIARDLRQPLEAILREARRLNLESLAPEAESALKLVDRLAEHGGPDIARMAVFDLNELLNRLCEFRQRAWHLMQLDVCLRLEESPLTVRAPRGLVEEALLGLIVVAEQSQHGAESARLDVETALREGSGIVTLSYPPHGSVPPAVQEGLEACRNLLRSCGASLEEERVGQEVRLRVVFRLVHEPAEESPSRAPGRPARPLTLLLVHPRPGDLRALIRALAERNHRVVPAADSIQALDMAARMRFDAVFAAPAGTDLEWTEFAARMKQHAPAVGWLASAARSAPPGILALPLAPADREIDECLAMLEATGEASGPSQPM